MFTIKHTLMCLTRKWDRSLSTNYFNAIEKDTLDVLICTYHLVFHTSIDLILFGFVCAVKV